MTFFDLPQNGTDPFTLFDEWLEAAKGSEINDYNAMCLATVGANGQPSARMVLLKDHGPSGFVFYTNAESHKGTDIAATALAAICFHWKSLERQIRIEGRVEKISDAEADAYFASRPRGSQIGAWVSKQSTPLASHAAMKTDIESFEKTYDSKAVPRPPFWQGFRVVPTRMEFWQAGSDRLHDRFVFTKDAEDIWMAQRLYP